jgi:hypothetical protein
MKANVLAVQKYLNKQPVSPKLDEDGLWGPKTKAAYDDMVLRKRIALRKASPWPEADDASLTAFFGPHGKEGGYTPPTGIVELPFNFYLYGNRKNIVRKIHVHQKLAEPYARVMERILEFYGSQEEIDQTGFTNWYGCYNPRLMRGSSTRWSQHAWAIATDHDANRNKLGYPRQESWMPEEVLDLFETEGIANLGRYSNTDRMHFFAAKP